MPRARQCLLILACALTLCACARLPGPAPLTSANPAAANAGTVFLAKNAKAPGVHVTPSGLQFRILRSGAATGLTPRPADEVKVNYEGKLLDGQVFDSSYVRGQPVAMTVRDLVPGWVEALQLMRPGDEWLLYLPPSLGYGDKPAGPIPPNSVLVFRLELLDVLSDASSARRG